MHLGKQREAEQQYKHTRLIMWAVLQKGNKRKISIEKILKLPSDTRYKETPKVLSKDEYLKLKTLWKAPKPQNNEQ